MSVKIYIPETHRVVYRTIFSTIKRRNEKLINIPKLSHPDYIRKIVSKYRDEDKTFSFITADVTYLNQFKPTEIFIVTEKTNIFQSLITMAL